MSALEDYQVVKHNINHGGLPPFSGEQMTRFRDAADAAIAELENKWDETLTREGETISQRDALLAALAALRRVIRRKATWTTRLTDEEFALVVDAHPEADAGE